MVHGRPVELTANSWGSWEHATAAQRMGLSPRKGMLSTAREGLQNAVARVDEGARHIHGALGYCDVRARTCCWLFARACATLPADGLSHARVSLPQGAAASASRSRPLCTRPSCFPSRGGLMASDWKPGVLRPAKCIRRHFQVEARRTRPARCIRRHFQASVAFALASAYFTSGGKHTVDGHKLAS